LTGCIGKSIFWPPAGIELSVELPFGQKLKRVFAIDSAAVGQQNGEKWTESTCPNWTTAAAILVFQMPQFGVLMSGFSVFFFCYLFARTEN